MVNSNVTTIILNGNEIKVEFERGYPYYQITNKGDADIYVSMSPNIIPESDGVYTVSAGGSEIIGEGYSFNTFYILGTGKVYIRGKRDAMSASFKPRAKGGDKTNHLTTDNLVFSLSDIEFTTYDTKVLLGNPSIYNLPLGIIPKTAEIVSKCGTNSNFLFSYGNGNGGQTFALTQDEFVGWYSNVSYADMGEARGKVRHIVCTNENKSVTIYVNGQKVVNTELSYPCDPNNRDFSLNSLREQAPLNTTGSALYVLRFYRKRLSESEVINNFKIFSQKYKIEV